MEIIAPPIERYLNELAAGDDEPVLLDEWQEVATVLGAVKRAVDGNPRPGRFLLTGSVRADLEATTWPGTGRLVRVPLYGMSVREQQERLEGRPYLDRLAAGDLPAGRRGTAVPGAYPLAAISHDARTT